MHDQSILLRSIKKTVSLIVAAAFTLGPTSFASAADEAPLPLQEQFATAATNAVSNESSAADIKEIDSIVGQQAEDTKTWADEREAILPQLLDVAARLEAEAKRIESLRGPQFLQTMIDKNQFMIEIENFGTAEYRTIDGQRVPRILHNDQVYILVDEKLISRDSPHLRQYIARTHVESGASRVQIDKNGLPKLNAFGGFKRKSGRDLTIAFFNDDASSPEFVDLPKPHFTNWSWWKDYYYAKKKKPTWDDFTLAIFSGGVLQAGLTYAMTMTKHAYLGTAFSWTPVIFTGLFGITIGTFASTYKNFTNNSISNFTRTLKRQFVTSMPYAYGLVIAMAPGDMHSKLATISFLTAVGLSKNLSLQVNGLSNNTAGAYWSGISQIRDKSRESDGRIIVNLNFEVGNATKTWRVINWSKSNFENQVLYIPPWLLNFVGLMAIGASTWSKVPGTDINVPLFQFLGIPIAMIWTKWYARRIANKAKADPLMPVRAKELEDLAKKYEDQWNNSFGMDVKDVPANMLNLIRKLGNGAKTVVSGCAKLLKITKADSPE